MDTKKTTEHLIDKYLAGECSENERAIIERSYLEYYRTEHLPEISDRDIKSELEQAFADILPAPATKAKVVPIKWWYYSAAAVMLVLISIAYIFIVQRKSAVNLAASVIKIVPGGNKAVLTLSNGNKITLDDSVNKELAVQAGVSVTKTQNGQLVYKILKSNAGLNAFNTIETPAGGQYQVILPDGTKVWLNALSSLRYPVAFTAHERVVNLKGEAYFEVAHDQSHPFIVASANQTVRVLGTHFNINAYTDEPATATTLLEGSVRVESHRRISYLKPGEQSTLTTGSLNVHQVDTDQTVAWKNGDFVFEGAPLKVIMRQVSRWYNVSVDYRGQIGDAGFGGSISRSKDISDVLKVLETTDAVHFKIEGRRITVMP